jgi:CrcB protein
MLGLGVAIGGGIGALLRYLIEGMVAERQRTPFPISTLIVNVTGSALLGGLAGVVTHGWISAEVAAWVGTGVIGGYTTFSTFTYETLRLVEDGAWSYALWNLALCPTLSFAAAGMGYVLARGH